jgi:hypothetical protein
MPDAPRAHALTHEQVVRAGETEALREAVAASQINVTASATRKACQTLQVVTLEQCVGGPCCSEWHCDYSITYITICGGGGGGGSGDDHPNPYPGGSGSGDCTFLDPPPGSDCEPADPCDGADPPFYCEGIDVNATERCPNDPLKDMEIRATCAGIEGGRFGEDARGEGNAHWGIDLLADEGTEVQVREGGVIWSKNQNDTFGRYLIIQSDDGTFTMYAHLSSRSVEGGDAVDKGDSIGETGTSGNACSSHCSCGPAHLHLEIREGGDSWSSSTPVDPEEEDRLGTEFDSDSGTAISDSCPS